MLDNRYSQVFDTKPVFVTGEELGEVILQNVEPALFGAASTTF